MISHSVENSTTCKKINIISYRALRPAVGLKHANTVKFLVGKVGFILAHLFPPCHLFPSHIFSLFPPSSQALWGIGAAWAITYYAYYNSGSW